MSETSTGINLSDQDRRFVEELIADGRFASASDAIAHALDLLRDEEGPPAEEVFETDEQLRAYLDASFASGPSRSAKEVLDEVERELLAEMARRSACGMSGSRRSPSVSSGRS